MAPAEDARVALLSRLIDHAPLFPPASLPLPEAIEEDRRARESAASFMLARFVCPASLLAELPDDARGVSVVLDTPLERQQRVEAVEVPDRGDLAPLTGLAPEVYVEVALDGSLEERLDALALHGLHAKVRCGGASAPDTKALAQFVRMCGERELAFKATAGLHHALRRNGEHGFLNLLAAVVFGEEESALDESDAGAFTLDSARFAWRVRTAGPEEIERARRERVHSIGSCSFFEPVEELEALGVLPL
ncbi:MAG: hypothetical protein H0U08_06985 [Actinobacteria bacterium]|nr:hypothetical protein [Actinomycetota bacterium]